MIILDDMPLMNFMTVRESKPKNCETFVFTIWYSCLMNRIDYGGGPSGE